MDKDLKDKLEKLEHKYELMGQDIHAYLDGLLLSNYLNYWDYTEVDTLLTLQRPRTDFPDELIFIIYHQITELYFRLALHELEQVAHNGREVLPNGNDLGWRDALSPDFFAERIRRVNSYFEALTKSFGIMVQGMEKEQFLRFRMALLPSSGFQSAQYRMIELCCAPLRNLVKHSERHRFADTPTRDDVEAMFGHIYWKQGATDLATGEKTLTLKQFEAKYSDRLIALAHTYFDRNMWEKFIGLGEAGRNHPDLTAQLRQLDLNVNVNWPLVHYKSAVRYLQSDGAEIAATGGTNWQKYLPPRFQRRVFFPELWTEEEKENWGRSWVNDALSGA